MASWILFNIDSGDGLLSNGIKSLPEPRWTYRSNATIIMIIDTFRRNFNLNESSNDMPLELSFTMMTSSNGNIFRSTVPLWGEFTGHQWRRALMFSFICAWTNDWANHRDAGDLRRHRACYDVTNAILIMAAIYPARNVMDWHEKKVILSERRWLNGGTDSHKLIHWPLWDLNEICI